MFYNSPLPSGVLIRFAVVAIVFTTVFAGGFTLLSPGSTKVNAALPFVPPANDNFLNAEPILPASGFVFGTTVGATKEPLEQNIVGINGTGSVWYKWQAPFSGRFVFMTSAGDTGNEFNTLLGVYSGANLPGIQVTANDDDLIRCLTISSLTPTLSRVAFDAVGGVVYHIAVDTKGTGGGTFKLRWGRSATITTEARSVSNGSPGGAAKGAKLDGDMCTSFPIFTFNDIPTGGSYAVSIIPFDTVSGYSFPPAKENGSTSPLTGDITLRFYLMSPAKSIFGRVTNLPVSYTGLTVTCVPANTALFTQTAKFTPFGTETIFECTSLPINADYVVTPSMLGFSFAPVDRTVMLFNADRDIGADPFVATAESPRTISGRVTLPNGTTGLSGATVALTGSQTDSGTTDSNGNYSFTVPYAGNYNVTPTHSNFTFTPLSRSFSNLTMNQSGDFTTAFVLQLILDDNGQVAALDSVLHTRDPFSVIDSTNLLNPGNTRVAIFVSGFQLGPGELASSVEINLVGSNAQTYIIPAEDVRLTSNPTFTQVIFKLPDTLAPGICTMFVKAHGLTSNIGSMKIKG